MDMVINVALHYGYGLKAGWNIGNGINCKCLCVS